MANNLQDNGIKIITENICVWHLSASKRRLPHIILLSNLESCERFEESINRNIVSITVESDITRRGERRSLLIRMYFVIRGNICTDYQFYITNISCRLFSSTRGIFAPIWSTRDVAFAQIVC